EAPLRSAADKRAADSQDLLHAMPSPFGLPFTPGARTPTPLATPAPPLAMPAPPRLGTPQPSIMLEPLPRTPSVIGEMEPRGSSAKVSLEAVSAAASAPAAMPPMYTGDELRFSSKVDFASARPHLESVGAILAIADRGIPN